jgi:uncharacterized protein (UPF0548 family)
VARVSRRRRLTTALTWPVGIGLTSWSYLWRTTPFHRRETMGTARDNPPPPLPPNVDVGGIQEASAGVGPLFRRRYEGRIRGAALDAEALMSRVAEDLNAVAPTSFARFIKTRGEPAHVAVGDEYVVRMPGPWDGPVRVVRCDPYSFRLATLDGHLEAGQIEFRARDADMLEFVIESWARSGDRFSNLLFAHLGVAKEVQLHLWTSTIERVARLSEGRLTGGVEIETRRIEDGFDPEDPPGGSRRIRRRLASLRQAPLNVETLPDPDRDLPRGWRYDRMLQELPAEQPGVPARDGSFAVARRLMEDYRFADPSVVRAFYDVSEPLERRTMLLEVRFHGMRFHIGVRVHDVYEREASENGRPVLIWGWSYGTLQGHFEMGQMDWQLVKFLDTGAVQFRIAALSRRAPVANLLLRAGFRLFGRRQQVAFLRTTLRRMAVLTAIGLDPDRTREDARAASAAVTAGSGNTAPEDAALAENLAKSTHAP